MAKAQKQVIVTSLSAPMPMSPPPPASVRPIDANILPEPTPSPARELQQRLQESTADLRLPYPSAPSRELPMFILSAVLLWGGVLGGIAGLMAVIR
jgi:hypothetical protein